MVLTEALDRLSRDQEGTAHLYKRLSYQGIKLETLSEGRISELHVGLNGTMNQLFLAELAKKTRRGLVARVKSGHSGGGRCYGYDIVPGEERGNLTINPEQAEVIRRIYRDYASGASPKAIAHALNREAIPGPRGGTWSPSAIAGDRRAKDGILCQELYVGVRVFNRRKFRKHPDTGKRSSVLNPESEWLRESVPGLRILDDELWSAVQSRQKALSEIPTAHIRKPKRLLSGLVKCGLCGGAMTLYGQKLSCSAHRERGTCQNKKVVAVTKVEQRVVAGLKAKLLAPNAVAEAVRLQTEAATAERRATLANRAPIERDLAEIERKIARAQEMCLNEAMSIDDFKAVKASHAVRREELEAKLANLETPGAVVAHPGLAERYAQISERLHEALDRLDGEDLRTELRALIERVDFYPAEGLGKFELKVSGKHKALVLAERASGLTNCEGVLGAGTRSRPSDTDAVLILQG